MAESRITNAILPLALVDEFNSELEKIEDKNNVVRSGVFKEKGNSFGMVGDTYHYGYLKGGKYKVFLKDLRVLWENFNKKHPKTTWKGK